MSKWTTASTMLHRNDFAKNTDCHFFRCARADVESDRPPNPFNILVRNSSSFQPLSAILVRRSASDCPDISDRCLQRSKQRWFIELGVMGKNGHIGVRTRVDFLDGVVRPLMHDRADTGKSFSCSERRTHVYDDHAKTKFLG